MQSNNRAMLIGGINAGKTTLKDALLERSRNARKIKTQSLTYDGWIVDTPGEYTENPIFYKNIMATSMEITHVLFIQDATNQKSIFAPGFSTGINKLPIGVVTKTDHELADIEHAVQLLTKAIVKGPIVVTSAYTGQGLSEIVDLVNLNSMEEMKEYAEISGSENITFHNK